MKSITIHKLDDDIVKHLEERAERERKSLNQVVKGLLRSALGLGELPSPDRRAEFADLFGTWTRDEAQAFDALVADLEQVEAEDW